MTNFADRTIWTGDNLDILRGLNSASVDLNYLDPPFNSNQNYAALVGSVATDAAFKETRTLSDLDVADRQRADGCLQCTPHGGVCPTGNRCSLTFA
jgi:adenine-specific DNA methylase